MSLKSGEWLEEIKSFLLVFITGKLFFEPIVDIQDVMVDCELIAFLSFIQAFIVVFYDSEF